MLVERRRAEIGESGDRELRCELRSVGRARRRFHPIYSGGRMAGALLAFDPSTAANFELCRGQVSHFLQDTRRPVKAYMDPARVQGCKSTNGRIRLQPYIRP
jgi:hypothetical protein